MPVGKYARAPRSSHSPAHRPSTSTSTVDALFQTVITDMRWDEDEPRWLVTTDRGDALRARFVVLANGR
jgi:cyclohexanone monooxygenase